jgi:iron complex transport system substrate-binding protein
VKIASLQPSISIILDRLGRLDALVACTRYCLDAVPALRQRPIAVVHDSWSTKAEELLPIRPDLVIASVPYRKESLEAILKAGCPVLALAPHSLADIAQDIRLIAAVAGVPERAELVVARMRASIEEVRSQTALIPEKPTVYCEEWGKPLIHSQFWVKELVEAAGGVFLGEPGAVTTAEAVARLHCIADELLNTPAPTLIEGLYALAAALHPQIFGAVADIHGRKQQGSGVDRR